MLVLPQTGFSRQRVDVGTQIQRAEESEFLATTMKLLIFSHLLRFISFLWLIVIYTQPFGGFIWRVFGPWPTWLNWFFELPWPPPMGTTIWPVALGVFGIIVGFILTRIAKKREMEDGYHDY